MRKIFPLLVILLVTACATQKKYDKQLQSFIGKTEKELVQIKGKPNSDYKEKNTKYLTYIDSDKFPTSEYDGSNIENLGQGNIYDMKCKTTFEIEKGVVARYSFVGNGCKSK